MIFQVLAAFLGTAAFSAVIEAPKKYLSYCGFIGAVGWLIYLINTESFGNVMANFLGSMAVSLISHIFARFFRVPVTIFLIPGILPLVPGAYLYKAVYQYFLGTNEIASWYLLLTIQIAGGTALAIFIMDSIFEVLKKKNVSGG